MALQPYVRIQGVPATIAALKQLQKNVQGMGFKRALLKFGDTIRRAYLTVVAVDTGLSKAWIRHGVNMRGQNRAILWIGPSPRSPRSNRGKSPFDYLHFPDHGTKFIKAQHFAGRAFRNGSARGLADMYATIRDAIRRRTPTP